VLFLFRPLLQVLDRPGLPQVIGGKEPVRALPNGARTRYFDTREGAKEDRMLEAIVVGVILILILLVSLLIWLRVTTSNQQKGMAAVKRMGGVSKVDEKRFGKPVVSIDLHNSLASSAGLQDFRGLTRLEYLDLSSTKITDPGLKHLAGLKRLRSLKLGATKITDSGLVHLKGLTRLESLDLHGSRVTEAGVEDFRKALPDVKIIR
jgi:hypothetical protein